MMQHRFPPIAPTDRLSALLASDALSEAERGRAQSLLSALANPVQVAVLTPQADHGLWLVEALIGQEVLPETDVMPTLDLAYGETPRLRATLEDGTVVEQAGWPSPSLMARAPILLRIEAPVEALREMSVLLVPLGTEHDDYPAALAWAARKAEMAIWCAPYFTAADAMAWSHAPERLTYHAFLVLTGGGPSRNQPHRIAFEAVFNADPQDPAQTQVARLQAQLTADIGEARRHDLDAAEVFLHRFSHLVPEPARVDPDEADETPEGDGGDPVLRHLVSEPVLYLRRRARALAGMLDWTETPDWADVVLTHCLETAEALRDRAEHWPDERPAARRLLHRIQDACDTTMLLQVEAGPAQAADAARLLAQMRDEFEEALAA